MSSPSSVHPVVSPPTILPTNPVNPPLPGLSRVDAHIAHGLGIISERHSSSTHSSLSSSTRSLLMNLNSGTGEASARIPTTSRAVKARWMDVSGDRWCNAWWRVHAGVDAVLAKVFFELADEAAPYGPGYEPYPYPPPFPALTLASRSVFSPPGAEPAKNAVYVHERYVEGRTGRLWHENRRIQFEVLSEDEAVVVVKVSE